MLLIRSATTEDTSTIVELWKEFMDFHCVRERFFSRLEDAPEQYGEFIRENISSANWLVLVATEEEKLVDYCMATIMQYASFFGARQYGFVEDLAVTGNYRGQGVGKQLFLRSADWFRSQGVTRIELRVASTNEVSQAFWQRLGFTDFIVRMVKEI